MITDIFSVRTTKGSGQVLCDIDVGAGGCNEDLKTTINEKDFSTRVQHTDAGTFTDEAIAHTESGLLSVVVVATTSGVSSNPQVLDL
jgi:hypothetical protein